MIALKTLLYFSIFKYPLTKEEIYKFSDADSKEVINREIDILIKKGIVFKFNEFYTLSNDSKFIDRRLKGNKMAKAIMPKANKVARFIAKFPYVESVSISGALAKGYYDDDGDIDFFIITKPNRLWVARTLLILYKKIFLLNSKKYFCVNYFISSNYLKISEQNRFTATEMVTLIPIYGKETFEAFIKENPWPNNYLPNITAYNFSAIKNTKKSWLSIIIEKALNTTVGNSVDELFRKVTLKKWHSKFGDLPLEDFKIAMKSTKQVSKHHPNNFQRKVIDRLNLEYQKIEKEHNLQIQEEYA